MNIGKIAICLAGALTLNVSSRADDAALPGNPYAPVVARNIFGLNPVTVVDTTPAPVEPPVKITPNGIMSIFGQLQVLFKVAQPPQRGKKAEPDQSYILAEGQRQDDIEVVHIDEKKSVITFNNHGQVQELPLADAPAASIAPPTHGVNPINHLPMPILPGARIQNRFGGRGNIRERGRNENSSFNNNSGLNSVPTQSATSSQQTTLTPEQQTIMIEAQRQYYKEQGSPIANLFPPTEATPQNPSQGGSQSSSGGPAMPPIP